MVQHTHALQEQLTIIQSDIITFQHRLSNLMIPLFEPTPRINIFENQYAKLYHYHNDGTHRSSDTKLKTPIFILYSFINKPTILDLDKNHSFIWALLQEGYDVYLVEWREPEQQQTMLGFDAYITLIIKQCIQAALGHAQQEKINLIGICQGGIFSLCFAALFPQYIRRLLILVTPINFQAKNHHWIKKIKDTMLHLPTKIDASIIPGEWVKMLFCKLNPMNNLYQKYFNLVNTKIEQQQLELFLKVETWLQDCPNQPYRLSQDFFDLFISGNQLMQSELKLSEYHVSLNNLEIPTYAIYAKDDHVVSQKSAHAISKIIHKKCYKETVFDGGHLSLFINKKVQCAALKKIVKFLDITYKN